MAAFITLAGDVFAQDPQFTQFYANPLYLNPAFAGTARCPRFIANYRNQWAGLRAVEGGYITSSASYDQHVEQLSGGIGVRVLRDNAGVGTYTTQTVSASYSYRLDVTRKFSIKAGLEASYYQKSLDWSKLNFGDQIDARNGFVYATKEYETAPGKTKTVAPDFAAGILGYSKKYFVGFAFHHLTRPADFMIAGGTGRLPLKFTAHAGAVIPIYGSNDFTISPNIMFQSQQNFQQLNLGVYVNKGPIVGGIWYRNRDAVIVLLGFQHGMYKFGYSYDVTVSKLAQPAQQVKYGAGGSHELSLAIQFYCKPKKKKYRTINCPSF